ncbi:thiamine diphosphokinase [Falsihalocynthiibacter sp. SS001]|uniref:thiamine diphosphokinase n=1 Tax=Falsihalocynthiibacter sp. SS001 TaxID=3349698 RepID=UPI0036D3A3C8
MNHVIVSSFDPITLIGGGEIAINDLTDSLALAPILVACDGGAKAALDQNHEPIAVIGDMDSIDSATKDAIGADKLHVISEQESNDFEKALMHCEAPVILGVGFTGTRLDHELAAFGALLKFASKRIILIGKHDVVFLAPQQLELNLPIGSRFSLFPMGAVRGTSEGLCWPIDGLEFAPEGRLGTSNEVNGPVRLTFEALKMLVILPREALPEVMRALQT